jgi:P-type E1-E2 ATPase
MFTLDIPGHGTLALDYLVLDVNGTIALDGALLPGVAERLEALRGTFTLHLVTADTHGRQREIDRALGLTATLLPSGIDQAEAKAGYVRGLGADRVVAIGNGANDALMLAEAALGMCVLGPEGTALACLVHADVVVTSVTDALDLLLHPRRLVATLRR